MGDPEHAGHRRQDNPSVGTPRRPPARPSLRRGGSVFNRPAPLQSSDLLELQKSMGNAAVTTLIHPSHSAGTLTIQRVSAAKGTGAQTWVRPGDTGPDVTNLQQRLNAIGSPGTPLTENGVYDATMRSTVTRFQSAHGLDPDGVVGPLTYEAMDREDSSGTAEVVAVGTDFTGTADAPSQAEIDVIKNELNPTSTGSGGVTQDWDGRSDAAKRTELDTEVTTAMQAHLDGVTPGMKDMETAKGAGQILRTSDQEGAGRRAKADVDAIFGGLANAAVLTAPQETARASFAFVGGVNLLDASDTSVRTPDPVDLADWIFETDENSRTAQTNHGFNERRTTQGEPTFAAGVKARFIAHGDNRADLARYDQFGFFFAEEGPRVLSQTAIIDQPGFSATPGTPGAMSDAERHMRWQTWEVLIHEYIHTLEHPGFGAATKGNRIMTEGFCELFTKDVLLHDGRISQAKADTDPARRTEVEGGDEPGFAAKFVPDYDSGEYTDYVTHAENIRAQVGPDAVRAAFFLGHVEHIGLKPNGDMIDPAGPDAAKFLAPERVKIPTTVRSVGAVSILTGAPEADVVSANPGLSAVGSLPSSAHAAGLVVPGTTQHRTLQISDRAGNTVVETKAQIAEQHGVSEHSLQRANPDLNHREPRPGEWVLIPVHP
ncbi:MAG: peptidoglycan-binding protein [Microlunatus sp.]|nr:peptidoglycan-binding protein [Microlunatus sp.]